MNRDVLWSAAEAGCAALLSVIASLAIARIIGSAEVGTGAAAVSVHVLLWVAVNSLFADPIAQIPPDDAVVSSALRASLATGTAAAAIQGAAGWALAWMLADPRLIPMALALALPLPLVAAAGVRQGVLTRHRAYRHLALRTILGQGAGAAFGIALALKGCGGWALVGQQALASSLGAAVLLWGWRPGWVWSWPATRALLRAGLPLTASTLSQTARYRLFIILIGGTAGAEALGQVHIAFRLVDTVRELTFTALWRLMLPALSEHRGNKAAMLAHADRLLRQSAMVTLPLCAILAVALPGAVAMLFGPEWRPAAIAALPLVGLMALLALMFPSGVALVAAGQARFALYANLTGLLATLLFVALFPPADAWQAVLTWCAAQVFVSPYALWVNGRALGVGMLRPLTGGLPSRPK